MIHHISIEWSSLGGGTFEVPSEYISIKSFYWSQSSDCNEHTPIMSHMLMFIAHLRIAVCDHFEIVAYCRSIGARWIVCQ